MMKAAKHLAVFRPNPFNEPPATKWKAIFGIFAAICKLQPAHYLEPPMFVTRFVTRRLFLISLLGMFVISISPVLAAKDKIFTGTFSNLAVSGYDPVAYFQEGKPVTGSDRFTVTWNGTTWRFASAANRDKFPADPDKFAPQYGGYCAWAVSQGYTASSDPEACHVTNGKLYLNYSKSLQSQWQQDIPGNIKKGDANWPEVLEK